MAWKVFVDQLPEDKKDKVALLAHTQPLDENGTDIPAVMEMIWGKNPPNVFLTGVNRFIPEQMNMLYNLMDACILISSNEGWGLSLTEAMMCGKPIIANVTGGMQDQMDQPLTMVVGIQIGSPLTIQKDIVSLFG